MKNTLPGFEGKCAHYWDCLQGNAMESRLLGVFEGKKTQVSILVLSTCSFPRFLGFFPRIAEFKYV